jgi:hypothetical protein
VVVWFVEAYTAGAANGNDGERDPVREPQLNGGPTVERRGRIPRRLRECVAPIPAPVTAEDATEREARSPSDDL